jgi:hypothetical protein
VLTGASCPRDCFSDRSAQQKGVPGRTLPGHSLSVSRRIVTKGLRLHVQGDPSGQAALAHLCEGNISPCDGESLLAFASSCVQSSCDLYLISWFPFASTFWGRHCSGGEPSSLTPFRPLFNVVSTDSAGQGASAGRDAIRNTGPLTLALVPRTGERGIEISQSAHAPSWSGLFHLPCTGIWHVVEEICCSHTATSTPLRRSCLDPEHENGFRNDRVAGLELSCVTVNGKTGTVRIAGQEFDLAAGSLILVASPDDKVIVRQLSLELPESPSAFDSAAGQEYSSPLQRIAREEAQIRDFFTEMHRVATSAEANDPDGDQ